MNQILNYKVSSLPDSAYYIPDFITDQEEKYILEKVYASPKPKWKTLSNRRLQNWGGLPHQKGMIPEEMPQWLMNCIQKVNNLQVFGEKTPNHVLINEYLPGQGIMPHEDGPLFCPIIATLNLGSHTLLNYYRKAWDEDPKENDVKDLTRCYVGSLLLERCSLLIVKDDLYHMYLHGIKEETFDMISEDVKNLKFCHNTYGAKLNRECRISLTIRHVPNTIKAKFLFKIK